VVVLELAKRWGEDRSYHVFGREDSFNPLDSPRPAATIVSPFRCRQRPRGFRARVSEASKIVSRNAPTSKERSWVNLWVDWDRF